MIVYWLACLGSVCLLSFAKKLKNKSHNVAILFGGLPLFLLSALRYGIGSDYHSYVQMYNLYFRYGFRGEVEPLFYGLNRALAYINLDAQWVFVICSAITIYYVFDFIFENSPSAYFSTFLFVGLTYYMSSFNIMRQFVAIAICLFSLRYVKRGKFIPFCLCILVAMGFHFSSLVFLVVYWFRNRNFSPFKIAIATVIVAISTPLITRFAFIVLQQTKYAEYVGTVSFNTNALFGIAVQICIIILASIYYDKNDETYKLLYCIQFIATCLTILGNSIPLIGRVKWYFGICAIALIPLAISKMRSKKEKLVWGLTIIVMVFIYAEIVVGVQGSYGCLPYQSIL